jgi:hypothetical protein
MKCSFLCCLIVVGLILAPIVRATGPRLINYQGILTDTGGTAVNGPHNLTFAIYPDSIPGSDALWSELQAGVQVSGGLFNVILGRSAPFPASLFVAQVRWLGIKVDTDPELAPRARMTSVPWAMHATVADSARYAPNVGGSDSDWIIVGNDMYSGVSGNIGIGETSPLVQLHVQRNDQQLPIAAYGQEEVIIEDSDACLGLYSNPGGTYGSALSFGEVSGGALVNKWTLVRTTGTASELRFRYGTNADYATNTTLAAMSVADGSSKLQLLSDGTAGSILSLKNGATKRGGVQFLDASDVVDAEISYLGPAVMNPTPSLRFSTAGQARMHITSAGDVGIGTGDPEARLEVRNSPYRGKLGGPTYGVLGLNTTAGAWGALGDVNGGVVASYEAGGTTGLMGTACCGVEGTHGPTGNAGALGTAQYGVQGAHPASGNFGSLGRATCGVYGYAGSSLTFAGAFDGRVKVVGNLEIWDATRKILELGEGLDFAEGFNVSETATVSPGTVLAIDPVRHGKLTVCEHAYDTRVAGIAAGARGLRSGVRLGVDGFDCDVALAGRVYCNVDARDCGVEAGDLLTTADTPGYAMKASDPQRSRGAILGKAMESLARGQRGQILVLVTLQ